MLRLYFLTSSRAKYYHAESVCSEYAVEICKKPHYGRAYIEPRIRNREKLLRESMDNGLRRMSLPGGRPPRRPFFIEDTSVRIEALSGDEDVPGVDVKYWMRETTFAELDARIQENGGDRSATVRSDVMLYIPGGTSVLGGGPEYCHFVSYAYGRVTEQEFDVKTNPAYPWLDDKTFNKWFIPDGENRPVSMLTEERARKGDFRRGAFLEMMETLRNRGMVELRREAVLSRPVQARLWEDDASVFVIVGLSCSGKTTLGRMLVGSGYYHIEASDYMRMAFWERHGLRSHLPVGQFAEEILDSDPGVVAIPVLDEIAKIEREGGAPVVITGFRAPGEIELLKAHYSGSRRIQVVHIDANESIRFERAKMRDGLVDSDYQAEFLPEDERQCRLGVPDIACRLADVGIVNEGTLDDLFENFVRHTGSIPDRNGRPRSSLIREERPCSLEDAILLALWQSGAGAWVTTTEIAKIVNDTFPKGIRTSKNNVSRYFNQDAHPYYRVKDVNDVVRYRLSTTGESRARWLLYTSIEGQS